MKARLHLYPHQGPRSRGYIVAEPAALRELAQVLSSAARGGTQTVKFYGSDGHEYELFVTQELSEAEWQELPLPHSPQSNPASLNIVKIYDEVAAELRARRQNHEV